MKRYIAPQLRIQSLPPWITQLGFRLCIIDVSGNPNLSRLPVDELCSIENLKEIRCEGCIVLSLPPPEIADQGGQTVVTYLRRVHEDGECNKRMSLILIGNGEAGKTSVLQALKSKDDRATKIDVDEGRTIGLDLHEWQPEDEEGLTFEVMDFGGQAVYSKTNQYFIVRRALYVLVWAVRRHSKNQTDAEEGSPASSNLKSMISFWMRAIQARVPGASVLLVATHIDLAENEGVFKQQCEGVKRCVEEELEGISEAEDEMIMSLNVLNSGESLPVNCLNGDGIASLRKAICREAKQLLWWNETIPRAFLSLKDKIVQESQIVPLINRERYISLVRDAGVHQDEMKIVTIFLHEMGVLKYFNQSYRISAHADQNENDIDRDRTHEATPSVCIHRFACTFLGWLSFVQACLRRSPNRIDAANETSSDDLEAGESVIGNNTAADSSATGEEEQKYSFEDTVFIDRQWMIQVFKGVMRHDWRHLLDLYVDDLIKLKKVEKMLYLGIIDEDILEDLWLPYKLREEDNSSDAKKRIDPYKAVALLRGCDLAHFLPEAYMAETERIGSIRELLCPGNIPAFNREHQRAIQNQESGRLCESLNLEYNIFPAGFLDRLLVRCAARHLDIDCSSSLAVVSGWGRML
eukprot:752375-Hanusia_phi.AAC.1